MEEKQLRERFEAALAVRDSGTGRLFMDEIMDMDIDYNEEEETVTVTVPVTDILFNPIGFIHGGIMTYIADTAMGHLCAAFADNPSVSLELKTQFFNTTREGNVVATAHFLKKGKNIQFAECDLKTEKGKPLGKVTATFYSLT
ncbi:MAG: PaaI family thioesterase [Bacillus sp. (in: Bacteria)]|nr:PaaI family thioesterase [Bacillus sp. (in: firmicutes)]